MRVRARHARRAQGVNCLRTRADSAPVRRCRAGHKQEGSAAAGRRGSVMRPACAPHLRASTPSSGSPLGCPPESCSRCAAHLSLRSGASPALECGAHRPCGEAAAAMRPPCDGRRDAPDGSLQVRPTTQISPLNKHSLRLNIGLFQNWNKSVRIRTTHRKRLANQNRTRRCSRGGCDSK